MVGGGVFRVEPDRFGVVGDGLAVLFLLAIDDTPVEVGADTFTILPVKLIAKWT